MGKNRQIAGNVLSKKDSRYARIIVFTGARQVGKTTLVKHILPEYEYISIEDPVLRKTYTKLTASNWRAQYPKAILDEIQKEPQLIESIKATYIQQIKITNPNNPHTDIAPQMPIGTPCVAFFASSDIWTHESKAPIVQTAVMKDRQNCHPVVQSE